MANICDNTKNQIEEFRQIITRELEQMLSKSSDECSEIATDARVDKDETTKKKSRRDRMTKKPREGE